MRSAVICCTLTEDIVEFSRVFSMPIYLGIYLGFSEVHDIARWILMKTNSRFKKIDLKKNIQPI